MKDMLFDCPISLRPIPIDLKRTKHFHILNLGAGVQSTTLYLMASGGALLDSTGEPIKFDYAVFSDTQEEPIDPGESVYDHLAWLEKVGSIPILKGTAGKLGDDLCKGVNSTGQRFASIPAYTKNEETGEIGATRRQCTREYKIEVIEEIIRRVVLGLKKGGRVGKTILVHQYIGISLDEIGRMLKAQKRQREKPVKWQHFHYPLVERGLTRSDCREYLKPLVPHRVPRSACVFCPFHDNQEWANIKNKGGAGLGAGRRSGQGFKNPRKHRQPQHERKTLFAQHLQANRRNRLQDRTKRAINGGGM